MPYNSEDYKHAGACEDCGGLLVKHIPTGEIFHSRVNRKCKRYG